MTDLLHHLAPALVSALLVCKRPLLWLAIITFVLSMLDRVEDALIAIDVRRRAPKDLPPTLAEVEARLVIAKRERDTLSRLLDRSENRRRDVLERFWKINDEVAVLIRGKNYRQACLGDPIMIAALAGTMGPLRKKEPFTVPGWKFLKMVMKVVLVLLLSVEFLRRIGISGAWVRQRRLAALDRGMVSEANAIQRRWVLRVVSLAFITLYAGVSAVYDALQR